VDVRGAYDKAPPFAIKKQMFKRSILFFTSGGKWIVKLSIKGKKMKKLMVMIAALVMFASSAYAADWNFYGSARMDTYYQSIETNSVTEKSTLWALQPYTSRIGANVKVSDELVGRFEYGASGGNASIRLLYGEWNFGAGKLLVGQAYSPLHVFQSSQAYWDYGMTGLGEVYAGRVGQIRLTFGDFQVAFVAPSSTYSTSTNPLLGGTGTDTEVKIPGIVAKYKMAADNWGLVFMGGYSSFEAGSTTGGQTVTSYMLGFGADITLGNLWLAANVSGGQNQGNLTYIETNTFDTASGYAYYNAATNALSDNDAMGFSLVVRYTINDMFAVEAGYGHQETELDMVGALKDKSETYYLQAPITLAPGVFLTPEIGVMDYAEVGQAEITYFGATWKINF
jgi:hypothetical protein